MKLRFFTVYDEHGQDSAKQLQYWDKDSKMWENIHHVRVSYEYEQNALDDENWVH